MKWNFFMENCNSEILKTTFNTWEEEQEGPERQFFYSENISFNKLQPGRTHRKGQFIKTNNQKAHPSEMTLKVTVEVGILHRAHKLKPR